MPLKTATSFFSLMKSVLTKPLAVLLVLLATTVSSMAQPTHHQGAGHAAQPEMKAYVQQHVLPVVRQQRQKLETQLAAADKAQLATYRAQLKELRQRSQALRQSFRASQNAAPKTTESTAARPALTEEQRQQARQLHTETRAIMLNVAQLAQKYESNIAQLAQEVQLQKEKWTTDMQAISAKNATSEQTEKNGRFQGRMQHHAGIGRYFRPAQFLLMDPDAAAPAERALGATNLYPVPATASSQLEYSVTKAGPVTVELLDGRGNIIRTIAQEPKQEKGAHTLPVNLSDLASGTYYYKITTRAGSETKRFVKE